jgi:hypothetical protein
MPVSFRTCLTCHALTNVQAKRSSTTAPTGFQINTRGLHGELRHRVRFKPVGKGEQPLHRGRKLRHVLVPTAAGA